MASANDAHRRLRVAVIGAGGMANAVHYPSLASFEDVEIAAIADVDPVRLNATADKYGVDGRYADYRRMVEAVAPEAVYAIGQPHIFYDIWTWCLTQGLNLCIEKPMGITLHQARALAHLAEKHGCITQVSFQRRACPVLALARSRCLERGPITLATCQFHKWAPQPYLDARDHMMDDGVHAIDTLRWMCGGEVTHLHVVARSIGTPDLNFFTVLLRFSTGATGVWMSNWTSGRRIFRVEMHSTGILADADPEGVGHVYADGDTKGEELDARQVAGSNELYVYAGFRAKNRQFIDAVKAGTQPESCFADALQTMEVAQRVLSEALLAPA